MNKLIIHGLWPILIAAWLILPMTGQTQPGKNHTATETTPSLTTTEATTHTHRAPDQQPEPPMDPPRYDGQGGPGFGPPPPGAPDGPPPQVGGDPFTWPDALDRWKDEDRRLQESVAQFHKIEAQRNTLLKALTDEKSHYDPDKMDPQAVITRQKVNNILAQLHELVEQDKKNTDDTARLFGFSAISMKFWGPVFKERLQDEGATLDPQIVKRLRVWVDGYEKSKPPNDPEELAITLLGDDFGPIVYQTAREHLEKMMGEQRRGPHRGPGRMLRESQGRWIVRIQRLEKRQEDLQNELESLGREIERLRRMVESDASWPAEPEDQGKPGEQPNPEAGLTPPSPEAQPPEPLAVNP